MTHTTTLNTRTAQLLDITLPDGRPGFVVFTEDGVPALVLTRYVDCASIREAETDLELDEENWLDTMEEWEYQYAAGASV